MWYCLGSVPEGGGTLPELGSVYISLAVLLNAVVFREHLVLLQRIYT